MKKPLTKPKPKPLPVCLHGFIVCGYCLQSIRNYPALHRSA